MANVTGHQAKAFEGWWRTLSLVPYPSRAFCERVGLSSQVGLVAQVSHEILCPTFASRSWTLTWAGTTQHFWLRPSSQSVSECGPNVGTGPNIPQFPILLNRNFPF